MFSCIENSNSRSEFLTILSKLTFDFENCLIAEIFNKKCAFKINTNENRDVYLRVENALENAFEHDYLNSMNTTIKTVLTRLQNIMNTTTKTLWTRLQKQYEHGYKKQYEHDCKNSMNTATKTVWTRLQKQYEHDYINSMNSTT